MPRKLNKVEAPEKAPRAESVPGSGKEKPAKRQARERKDPFENMSYEEAYRAFDEADEERRRAEAEVRKLRAELVGGGRVTEASKKKLQKALAKLDDLEDQAERLRLVASRKFEKEELPAAMEKLDDEAAFEAFLEAEDASREAEKRLRELKKEIFKSLKGAPTKSQRADLREAEEAANRAKEQMEEMRRVAKIKNEEAHLVLAGGVTEKESEEIEKDLDFLEGGVKGKVGDTNELHGYDQKIASLEVAIDDLREAGGSPVEIQEKVQELAELKEERSELERGMREGEGERVAGDFESVLREAKEDELLAPTAERYETLMAEQKKLETKIKKLTGHEADDILLNPSLAGGAMKRFGDRIKGFVAKLAGTESEPTVEQLMREWKAAGREMEELSNALMPSPDFGHEVSAAGKLARTDEETEVNRALDREAARDRDAEYIKDAELLMADVKSELQEITLYDDVPTFIEHMESHVSNREDLQNRLDLLESHESESKPLKSVMKDLAGVFETYKNQLDAKLGDVKQFEEEAKGAGKGKRVMSKLPGRAFGASEPTPSFGAEAMRARHRRVEVLDEQGPKSELSPGPDEYAEEIQAYRRDQAQAIKTVIDEYPPAAALWDQMSEVFEQHLDPDEYAEISRILGTRDIATAYVLEAAFASMDGNKDAKERIAKVNKILLIPEDQHVEAYTPPKKTKEKKLQVKKRSNGGKKKAA